VGPMKARAVNGTTTKVLKGERRDEKGERRKGERSKEPTPHSPFPFLLPSLFFCP
jgi:hypothetical protein